MRKYYLEKQRHPGYTHDTFERNLILNSPTEQITVSEDVEWPNIEFSVGLLEQSVWPRPKNTKYSKYKEIKQEDYLESVHKVGSFSVCFSFDCFSVDICP